MFSLESIEKVMVFGAHPDDEIIGPGGTMHNLSKKNKDVYVVTFTCGGTAANSPAEMEEMVEKRKKEMAKTDEILGIRKREVLQIPSQQVYAALYSDNKLHHELIRLIRMYRPEIIFAHSKDNHRDHNAISTITRESAFQSSESILTHLGDPCPTPLVLYYSVEQELMTPNIVIEISKDDLEAKLGAIKTQISQERTDYLRHFEEMIEGRSRLWGAKFFGSGRYAEPFYLDYKTPLIIKNIGKN